MNLWELQAQYKNRLARGETKQVNRLIQSYGVIWKQAKQDLDAVLKKYAEAQARGEPIPPGWIYQQERARALMSQIEHEVRAWSRDAQTTTANLQKHGIDVGTAEARALLEGAGVGASFTSLPRGAIEAMVGFTEDGAPLTELFNAIGPDVRDKFEQALLVGIGTGQNPREVARLAQKSMAMGLARATRIARTEMLRAWRTSSHETYQANSDVVDGWIWSADLSPRTCASCLAMHGTFHKLDERLDDHPNGRCLLPGQLIETNNGTQPIELIKVGDIVLTHRGNYRRVMATSIRQYTGKIVRLTQGRASLVMTPEHPVLTQRGWVLASNVKVSDTLRTLNDVLARLSNRNTRHPFDFKRLSFLESFGSLFLELCQRLSNSTASFCSGNAKSTLKISNANSGMGNRFIARRASSILCSPSLKNFSQLRALCWERLSWALRLPADFLRLAMKLGSLDICACTDSFDERGTIWHSRISRIIERVLIPSRALMLRYVAPLAYSRFNQMQIGSPILPSNFAFQSAETISPRISGDLKSPNLLAWWWTDFVVRPFNFAAMDFASIFEKLFLMKSSSWIVHALPDMFPPMGNMIHQDKINVKHEQYNGLVYNLQVAEDESYIANGIVTHNCAMLPVTQTWSGLGFSGIKDTRPQVADSEQWLHEQDPLTQARILGFKGAELWNAGKVGLHEFTQQTDDPRWGTMRTQTPVSKILSEKEKRWQDFPQNVSGVVKFFQGLGYDPLWDGKKFELDKKFPPWVRGAWNPITGIVRVNREVLQELHTADDSGKPKPESAGLHALTHETIHSISDRISKPSDYQGRAKWVEELTTEWLTRKRIKMLMPDFGQKFEPIPFKKLGYGKQIRWFENMLKDSGLTDAKITNILERSLRVPLSQREKFWYNEFADAFGVDKSVVENIIGGMLDDLQTKGR